MKCSLRDLDVSSFYYDSLDFLGEMIVQYTTLENALKVLVEHPTREITFKFNNYITEDQLLDLKNIYRSNDKIRISISGAYMTEEVRESGVPYYLDDRFSYAGSFDDMYYLASIGVCMVIVSGELGFKMKEMRQFANKLGIKIKVIPNVPNYSSESGLFFTSSDGNLKAFWIRPNDLEDYEPYVDYVEFLCDNDKQHIYYEIYFIKKDWFGDLKEIMPGLEIEINNKFLYPGFGMYRMNCGKSCLVHENCHKCESAMALCNLAQEKDILARNVKEIDFEEE